MDIFKILIGVLSLFLAWAFLFRTGLIFRVNAWVKENVFSDNVVLFSSRRMALLLLVLGGVALFSGIDGVIDGQSLKPNIVADILQRADEDFQKGRYKIVIQRCKEVVRSNKKNVEAWVLLSKAWWTLGKKRQATQAVERILQIKPTFSFEGKPVLQMIHMSKKETR